MAPHSEPSLPPAPAPWLQDDGRGLMGPAYDDSAARFLVIDTACQRSVVGTLWMLRRSQQVKARSGFEVPIKEDAERFKFGDGALRKSDGRACIPVGLNLFVVFCT